MRKSFGDFHDLLLANAQILHQGRGIQRLFEAIQKLTCNLFLFGMLDDAASCDLASDEDVLRNAEVRKEFQFLKDNPDPGMRVLT